MRSPHSFMHHEIGRNGRIFTGTQYRPTDDNVRWSAPFQGRGHGGHGECERPRSGVLDVKTRMNRVPQDLLAHVQAIGVDLELWRAAATSIRGQCKPNQYHDCHCNQP